MLMAAVGVILGTAFVTVVSLMISSESSEVTQQREMRRQIAIRAAAHWEALDRENS